MSKALYNIDFQRQVLRLLCTNMKFAAEYGSLLKPQHFDSQPLRIVYGCVNKSILTFEKELLQSDLLVLIDEYSISKSLGSEVVSLLKEESHLIYHADIRSEDRIIGSLIKFCTRQEVIKALTESIEIVKDDGDFAQISSKLDSAISIGNGVSEGYNIEDLMNLPALYKKMYDPTKLIATGIPQYDRALLGGMGPSEVHVIQSPPKCGKCVRFDTPILMHNGSTKKVQDVVAGDVVMGVNGEPRNVLGTNQGESLLYKVKQDSSSEDYYVNAEHILTLLDTRHIVVNGEKVSRNKLLNMNVVEYKAQAPDFKKRVRGIKSAVDFPSQDVPLDPYFLGIWLGDGITARGMSNPILDSLKHLELLNNKHIPDIYKFNSREVRLSVLAGLFDTDGYNDNDKRLEITSKYESLANDIVFVARSLGFKASISIKRATIKDIDFVGKYHRINIYGDFSQLPMLVKRKVPQVKMSKNPLTTAIEVIEDKVGKWAGFEVDGDNRFLLGDFTITHNSTLATNIGSYALTAGKKVFHITLEIKEVDVLSKYATRLSGLTYKQLLDSPHEYDKRIQKFARFKDQLFVKYWTEGTVNTLTIRSWISRLRSKGHSPDLIIIDYDDCLVPVAGNRDMYEDAGNIYSDLKGLADYFSCPCLTFAQPNRMSWDKPNQNELIHAYDLAHSAKKAHKAFSVSSMNFADGNDTGLLYVDMVRRGESNVKVPMYRELTRGLIMEKQRTADDG